MGKKESIIKRLETFRSKLDRELPVERMIFFGSRARGKADEWSDIDLVIVSESFRGKKFRYRPMGFHKHWSLKYAVDFLCCTPEEFERLKNEMTIIREAVKEGIEIGSN